MQVVLDVFDKNNNFQQKNISYHFMIFEKNSSWFLKWSIGHPCIHRSFSICVYFQRTHTYTLIQIWPRHRTNKHWLEILIAEQEGVDSGFHVFNVSILQCPSWACVEQEERENKLTKVWVEGCSFFPAILFLVSFHSCTTKQCLFYDSISRIHHSCQHIRESKLRMKYLPVITRS